MKKILLCTLIFSRLFTMENDNLIKENETIEEKYTKTENINDSLNQNNKHLHFRSFLPFYGVSFLPDR